MDKSSSTSCILHHQRMQHVHHGTVRKVGGIPDVEHLVALPVPSCTPAQYDDDNLQYVWDMIAFVYIDHTLDSQYHRMQVSHHYSEPVLTQPWHPYGMKSNVLERFIQSRKHGLYLFSFIFDKFQRIIQLRHVSLDLCHLIHHFPNFCTLLP